VSYRKRSYKGLVSSDWSECLSPNGPFDLIRYSYPDLKESLTKIFRDYTGNQISLGEASGCIQTLLPEPVSIEQMDAYLKHGFDTYPGVAELIEWCQSRNILFMINTTGMVGYFQRVLAKRLLPRVTVLSANPLIRYPQSETDPEQILELFETRDKGRNTAEVARNLGIAPDKIVLVGDSGGDGPHFEWGSRSGATLVGSMTKKSLHDYCRKHQIQIHHRIGADFSKSPPTGGQNELVSDLADLCDILDHVLQI
jgi:2-hydroxy-3-keto-5-methylthiopentenyl-1-phosphate phosphatase